MTFRETLRRSRYVTRATRFREPDLAVRVEEILQAEPPDRLITDDRLRTTIAEVHAELAEMPRPSCSS